MPPVRAIRTIEPAPSRARRRGEVLPRERLAALASEWERALPGVDGDAVTFFAHLDVLAGRVRRAMEGWLRPHGLVHSEYRVLSVLRTQAGGAGLTPASLQVHAAMTSAGMARALTRLEAAGYVRRTKNPVDGRSTLASLSKRGAAFAEHVCRAVAAECEAALAPIPDAQRSTQLRVLSELIDFVDTDEGAA